MSTGHGREFERLIETIPVGMLVTDAYANITQVNPKCCELLGYTKSQLIAKGLVKRIWDS